MILRFHEVRQTHLPNTSCWHFFCETKLRTHTLTNTYIHSLLRTSGESSTKSSWVPSFKICLLIEGQNLPFMLCVYSLLVQILLAKRSSIHLDGVPLNTPLLRTHSCTSYSYENIWENESKKTVPGLKIDEITTNDSLSTECHLPPNNIHFFVRHQSVKPRIWTLVGWGCHCPP
jgi:hypothetical protein